MTASKTVAAQALALVSISSASAADLTDMLGKWKWQQFTIEVTECAAKGICSKVIAGPKNVGMDLFASELTRKDGAWYGRIMHPATGETYATRIQPVNTRTWRLDGCTASGVCLSGEFVRTE